MWCLFDNCLSLEWGTCVTSPLLANVKVDGISCDLYSLDKLLCPTTILDHTKMKGHGSTFHPCIVVHMHMSSCNSSLA